MLHKKVGNLNRMGVCANCGLPLEDKWKFCIHCGARVEAAKLETSPAAQAPAREYVVPYNDDEPEKASHVGARKFRFDWQLGLGILLAGGGIAMIIYLVVVLVIPHT